MTTLHTLASFKKEGGKAKGTWTVTGVVSVKDRPGKQINRFDVTSAGGGTVELSAHTVGEKDRWTKATDAAKNGSSESSTAACPRVEGTAQVLRWLWVLLVRPALFCCYVALLFFCCCALLLPACFVLLVVRATVVERSVDEGFATRQKVLAGESRAQRMLRGTTLALRALPALALVVGWPLLACFMILPHHPGDMAVAFGTIGCYLVLVLVLVAAGNLRGFVAFRRARAAAKAAGQKSLWGDAHHDSQLRHQERKLQGFAVSAGMKKPQIATERFHWHRAANVIAIASLGVECLQLCLFGAFAMDENAQQQAASVGAAVGADAMRDFVSGLFGTVPADVGEQLAGSMHLVHGASGCGAAAALVLCFAFQLLADLRRSRALKLAGRTHESHLAFFHGFVGAIVYGHGDVQRGVEVHELQQA